MLIGQKKPQNFEQNWFVVLNSTTNEIDKRKVAQKISEVFVLSFDEARDLVSNTPIILLDNLTKSIAVKLRDYFRPLGANMTLSNDSLYKRKCYRTIWPHQPNLNFLHTWKSEQPRPSDEQEVLDPDEALNEIRSLSETSVQQVNEVPEPLWPVPQETQARPTETFIESTPPVQEEALRQKEVPAFSSGHDSRADIQALERKFQEAEKRYGYLQEEYRQARNLFEDKLLYVREENQDLKRKLEGIQQDLHGLEKDKQKLQTQLQERTAIDLRLYEEKEIFERQFEQRFKDLQLELESSKRVLDETQIQFRQYETVKAEMNVQILELGSQLNFWREKAASMATRLEETEQKIYEEKDLRSKLDEKIRQIQDQQTSALRSYEAKLGELSQNQLPLQDFAQTFSKLEQMMLMQGKVLENLLSRIERKEERVDRLERELSNGSHQTKVQVAEENLKQLSSRLQDKEILLKRLVTEQQNVEKEIQQREEALKGLLREQESVEKEILEVKQARHHYQKDVYESGQDLE